MFNSEKPLTDAEIAELERNRKALGEAYRQDPKGTVEALREAYKDMRDFPAQNGDLNT